MGSEVAILFERLLPESLAPLLGQALGSHLSPGGETGLHRVCASGRYRGRQIADLLAFCASQSLEGALLIVEPDEERVLYFRNGRVVGASSTVLFERVGRLLYREGAVDRDDMDRLINAEETHGMTAAASMLPRSAVAWALERRVWELAATLTFLRRAHFLVVEGTLDMGDLPTFDIEPSRLAMEGMRAYDEWRNTGGRESQAEIAIAAIREATERQERECEQPVGEPAEREERTLEPDEHEPAEHESAATPTTPKLRA